MIADNDALKSKPGPPRPEPKGSRCLCASVVNKNLLIKVARQRARGVSWALIAEKTPCSEGELLTFSIDQPEIWGPLYARAEKLRLAEAEGQGLAHLTALLKGDDETAAEKASRELLIHRRHVQRRRLGSGTRDQGPGSVGGAPSPQSLVPSPSPAEGASQYPEWLVEEPAPAELGKRIIYAANRVAHGEAYGSFAREVGHAAEEIARWAFIYPKTWDRVYPQARLAAAQFAAALAINRLLDLVAGPDAQLAARAARTLLVHRRHMHWNRENQPPRRQDTKNLEGLNAAEVSRNTGVLPRGPKAPSVSRCLCGEKRGWRVRDGPG